MQADDLIAGPYEAPECEVGDILHDEMLGDVEVVGFQRGSLRWPLCKAPITPGPRPLNRIPVLCGDLVRAVCEETNAVVCKYWKVPRSVVLKWRRAITGVQEGLESALALKRMDPKFRKKFYR
jgi:hypothetical protein